MRCTMSVGAVGGGRGPLATSPHQYEDRYDVARGRDRMDGDSLDYGLQWIDGDHIERSTDPRGQTRTSMADIERSRADGFLTEAHSGLSSLGTTIKIVTALLTVFGADDNRRSHVSHKVKCF